MRNFGLKFEAWYFFKKGEIPITNFQECFQKNKN